MPSWKRTEKVQNEKKAFGPPNLYEWEASYFYGKGSMTQCVEPRDRRSEPRKSFPGSRPKP